MSALVSLFDYIKNELISDRPPNRTPREKKIKWLKNNRKYRRMVALLSRGSIFESRSLYVTHTHTRKCVYSQRIYKYIYGCIRIYNNRRILYRRLCACVNIRAWVGASSVFIIALETRVKLLFWPGAAKTKKKEKV